MKIISIFIPYSIIMRLYFYFFRRKKKKFNQYLLQKGYKNLSDIDISKCKTSNKLFVIGSGYSLNNIKPKQWGEINKHDIFGFNFSFINNDHIPTFYTTEAMTCNVNGQMDVSDIFSKLYMKKSIEYNNVIKFISDLETNRLEHFEKYAKILIDSDNFYILETTNGIAKNKQEFAKLINYYQSLGLFDIKKNIDTIFKFRATLCMAISFGINLDYKEIILCGIDLNDPRYFYMNREKYPDLPEFRSSRSTPKHTTMFPLAYLIPIDAVIYEIYNSICRPKNIKLYIQNPESALAPFLPIYVFNEI